MAPQLAPLFTRLEQLAPQFVRAEQELLSLVARGRSGDHAGAGESARRVAQTVLRHVAAVELGAPPAEATLEDLLAQLRRAPGAAAMPTQVLEQLGALQAAGAAGPEALARALEALVAVLGWYAERYGPAPAKAASAPAPRKKTHPVVMALALVIPIGGGLYALWMVTTQGPTAVEVANAGVALNKFYLANKEPPPSGRCRITDTRTLIQVSHGPGSLALLKEVKRPHPEVDYLTARALVEAGQPADELLAKALECPGFAAAHALKAKLLEKAEKKDEAAAELEKALEAAPDWSHGRYSLGVLEVSRGREREGVGHLEAWVEAAPQDGDGWLMLGAAYEALGRKASLAGESGQAFADKARQAFCEAAKRGKREAKARCDGA